MRWVLSSWEFITSSFLKLNSPISFLMLLSFIFHQNIQHQIMFENIFGAQLMGIFFDSVSNKELLGTVKYGVLAYHTSEWIKRD